MDWGNPAVTQVLGANFSGSVDLCFQTGTSGDGGGPHFIHAGVSNMVADASYVRTYRSGGVTYHEYRRRLRWLMTGTGDLVSIVAGASAAWTFAWTVSDAKLRTAYQEASSSAERGPVHAKEAMGRDEWYVPAGAEITASFAGLSWSGTLTEDTGFEVLGLGAECDPDFYGDWSGYAISFANIVMGESAFDASGYTQETWYNSGGLELYAEGVGHHRDMGQRE